MTNFDQSNQTINGDQHNAGRDINIFGSDLFSEKSITAQLIVSLLFWPSMVKSGFCARLIACSGACGFAIAMFEDSNCSVSAVATVILIMIRRFFRGIVYNVSQSHKGMGRCGQRRGRHYLVG